MKIKNGDEVLLVSDEGNNYFVKAENRTFHLSDGKLDLSQLIGADYGQVIKTHIGKSYATLKPNFLDNLQRLQRGPQVILPKDAATIVAYTGVTAGSKIVEAGSGSGWLTLFLAHSIAPTGKITSYEIREDFYKLTKANLKFLDVKNVTLKNKDITKGFSEKNLDLIVLDMLTPTKVYGIKPALKLGGYCVAYVPHEKQVEEFVDFARKQRLHFEKALEVREKRLEIRNNHLRSSKKQLPHTGFLVFVRKINN